MKQKFRKIKVGTGITQGDAFILGDVVDEESRLALKELLERQQRNSGLLSERTKRAAAELNGGTPPPPGTKNWDDPTVSPKEWYAREIADGADNMLTFLDMVNHTMGTKLTEKDIHAVLVAAYGLGRLTKEAEMKFKWEPTTERGQKFTESKRGRSELYHTIEQLLEPGDSNHDLLQKLYDEAGNGGTIQEVAEDDYAEISVYWCTRNGVGKQTSLKSVFNMAAAIRKKKRES